MTQMLLVRSFFLVEACAAEWDDLVDSPGSTFPERRDSPPLLRVRFRAPPNLINQLLDAAARIQLHCPSSD